ncbi:transporter substrate-binding domain-containing protein [Agrobacterium tumefaciens]|uniref:transporter substrate-binding domain-containing protein n=1 Tax=Agrobacterium tumefaciens TaxID=358 RepID=UPI0015725290|nr:transporter substrate-binding domain-containing protein [Agrobacterium tumefaciens]
MTNLDQEAVRKQLAPTGTLICALNHGNVVLVRRGQSDDSPTGVSVDIARAVADSLSLPIRFRHYDKAGDVSGSAGNGEWDVCFLAIDPKRAERIAYSEPYVQIEGAYLVPRLQSIITLDDFGRSNSRIGAVRGSAYELFLSRQGWAGRIVRFDSFPQAVNALEAGEVDGLAGVRQAMQKVADEKHDLEVMGEAFMAIPQAVGVSSDRPIAAEYIAELIRRMKASGFIRRSLDLSGHEDVVVPA